MKLKVSKVDVWGAEIEDRPGGLANKLQSLASVKANLAFVLARRAPEAPGHGVAFITPLRGARQVRAAEQAGFVKTDELHSVRVEGPDRPGLGADMLRAIAEAGINLRGLSAAVIGRRFMAYFALDTADDADRTAKVLKALR